MAKFPFIFCFILTGSICHAQTNKTKPYKQYKFEASADSCESWLGLFDDSSFFIVSSGCFNDERKMGSWSILDSAVKLISDTSIMCNTPCVNCCFTYREYFDGIRDFIRSSPDTSLTFLFKHETLKITNNSLIRKMPDGKEIPYHLRHD